MKPFILGIIAAGVALWPLPGTLAHAGCRSVAVHHGHVKQQLVVGYAPAYPAQYYAVGQQLQASAFEDRIVDKLVARLQAPQQQTAPCPTCRPAQPQTLPLTAEVDRWALTKNACQSCHETNENAKAAFDMSDLSSLTCEQKLSAIREVLDGRMPKGRKLDPQVIGNLLGEFAGADTAHQP